MNEKQTERSDNAETIDRSAWEAPEVRRLAAGDAEAASGTGDDTGVFS